MKREIKFRMWDAEEGTMVDGDSLAFEEYAPLCDLLTDTNKQKFMQYTGVKDADGVEIYEGDIVRDKRGTGIVEYLPCCAMFTIDIRIRGEHHGVGLFPLVSYTSYDPIHVLGNIYENPEILKEDY